MTSIPKTAIPNSKWIREEIVEVFDVSISGELLRLHFSQWKQSRMLKPTTAEDTQESDVSGGICPDRLVCAVRPSDSYGPRLHDIETPVCNEHVA